MTKPNYCDFPAVAAVAGKDLLLTIWSEDGEEFLAISGQQSLTINRSADTIEVSSKDTAGGWKAFLSGMKEWSIDSDGIYAVNDASHRKLSEAFNNGDLVCVRVINNKTEEDMFGGLAVVTSYPIEAPFDAAVTYSISLSGNGKLTDLSDGDDFDPDED